MQKMFVANKALIENAEGKILMIRDAGVGDHAALGGLWDVPGGRMDAFETPYEGLCREVKEEVGIDIHLAEARPVYVDKWGVNGDIANQPIVGIFWIISLKDLEITLSDEHTEYQWADPESPPSPLMAPLRRAFLFLSDTRVNSVVP